MSLFMKAESSSAYLKAGFLGFAGSGKTYTASLVAAGLVRYLKERELPEGDRPVFFLDTETGADYVRPLFAKEGIELYVSKTRAFSDLKPAIEEAQGGAAILLIDSLTHYWTEFCDTYLRKKRERTQKKIVRLEFQDWAFLKEQWRKGFTDLYVNSALHIILCGRAGYEYDFFENDEGKKELEKTGVKMRAESETGFEPSLLVLMERHMDMDNDKRVYRMANVLKERFSVIDGKMIKNPTFDSFLPHIELLNLGGKQLGVDTTRTSDGLIPSDGKAQWQKDAEQRDILLEKIQATFTKHLNTASAEGKKRVISCMERHFGTPSWKELEKTPIDALSSGLEALRLEFEPAQEDA